MVSMDAERTIGTRVYLKMGQNMLRAYTEPNISVKERTLATASCLQKAHVNTKIKILICNSKRDLMDWMRVSRLQ